MTAARVLPVMNLSDFIFILFQLDEDVEQWPHLHELVQCYRADWVKDDNKYGHYESIGPTTFQNQTYEGPDTDIETGELVRAEAFLNNLLMCNDKISVINRGHTCSFFLSLTN